ncbi:hypothetical protein B0T26DRAFT_751682 [Lasiosphaeria miniovina]|uniref:Uncharacterized protein n=1 Tax=Lasiosphaeria miniovina TaxID=1954250 RepID=A0AA40DZY5_9PEZI|nr:uncharacterized protein B0T26DRAFT_751682 [Lasiosphaeria miniovina]KAK0717648.1 hypothetical protein B0T26DRAFT_751682 [Lasiosphaeria miniovina]
MSQPEYPGWNRDLRWSDQEEEPGRFSEAVYPMGIHNTCRGGQSAMLLVREVAMMAVMDRLTDKPDWQVKVFDEAIAEKWRQEALASAEPDNVLSRECVEYCILELRHKAHHFKRTGITPTLDATFSIAKSDVLVPLELHSALRGAFFQLQTDQSSNPDWHPNTNNKVQDLVHPSMYPLVYGRSRFFADEVVGVDNAIYKFAGKGEVIPRRPEWGGEPTHQDRYGWFSRGNPYKIPKHFWSTFYQWLPANVKFTTEGGVQFTSYINNLHPTKYRDTYKVIEKLVEKALPMWDQCLSQDLYRGNRRSGAGRHEPRIVPEDADDENPNNWDPKSPREMLNREAAEDGTGPGTGERRTRSSLPSRSHIPATHAAQVRWENTRKPAPPQPPPFAKSCVSYAVNRAQSLRKQFQDTGLQIIVKMASIELTPENPEFPQGGWHVEGQMNEHIVGTVLYYLDSDNVTDSHLDFRAAVQMSDGTSMNVGQDRYHWMEHVYGVRHLNGSPRLQNYGSVLTREGRLLAFPNVFQHRVSGFRLADPSKPGHRRFIALWLVDPLTRIISTANVPPQQADWWSGSVFGGKLDNKMDDRSMPLSPDIAQLLLERGLGPSGTKTATRTPVGAKLPPEVLNMVRHELDQDALPMTRSEAEHHRLKLMAARSAFQDEARDQWNNDTYSFCEH